MPVIEADQLPQSSPLGVDCDQRFVRRWLVAEYCGHDLFMGWHLYLRDSPKYQTRNADGEWGWLRSGDLAARKIVAFMASLGIKLTRDWSCPEYGPAEFVKRHSLPGRKVWGETRGGVEVLEDHWGNLTLYSPNAADHGTAVKPETTNERE